MELQNKNKDATNEPNNDNNTRHKTTIIREFPVATVAILGYNRSVEAMSEDDEVSKPNFETQTTKMLMSIYMLIQ